MQRSGSNTESEGCQVCLCGRSFLQLSAFSKHQRSCQKSKRRLSNALGKAKQKWTSKRRKLDLDDHTANAPAAAGLAWKPLQDTQDEVEV